MSGSVGIGMHTAEAIEFYTRNHSRWFEGTSGYEPDDCYLNAYQQNVPLGWELHRAGIWFSAQPCDTILPDQGWKLHVSVSTENSLAALNKILPILFSEQTPFKFLLDMSYTALTNGKLWPRGSSGKFMTIYPLCQKHFYTLGELLSKALVNFTGPYILSDRRWPGSSSLYYRYGGFSAYPVLQHDGTRKLMIRAPSGERVPDIRVPFWNPPSWVEDPFPVPHSEVNSKTLASGRFEMSSALSFTNRGGVYKGTDTLTGKDVVIKEARPRVEIGANQHEAVSVLEKEYRILKTLADSEYFVKPELIFQAWEHSFLVEEFIDGVSLGRHIILNNPIYSGTLTKQELYQYFEKMRSFWIEILHAIQSAHDLGITLGDLSFTNIIIQNDRIQICDLETARQDGVDSLIGLHTPGMVSSNVSDYGNDYHAFGVLIFGSIMLAHGICGYFPGARKRFLDELKLDLALPEELIELINDLMGRPEEVMLAPERLLCRLKDLPFRLDSAAYEIPRACLPRDQRYNSAQLSDMRNRAKTTLTGISQYLLNTYDTDRDDRLYPADLLVFETNPLSVSYGAAGVLHALHYLDLEIPSELLDWFLSKPCDNNNCPSGLYIGQSGIAWVLMELGYRERAERCLQSAGSIISVAQCPNVIHGAAGYGISCLKLWTQGAGDRFLEFAINIGKQLRYCSRSDHKGTFWPDDKGDIRLGYAYGGSGISLFLLYLSIASNDKSFLELGRRALNFELAQGVWIEDKFAGFPDKITPGLSDDISSKPSLVSCYWLNGSAGVGTAVIRYYAVTKDQTLRRWIDDIAYDCGRKYTAFPQLFQGLSGLGNYLLDAWAQTGNEQYGIAAWEAAEGARLFRIDCEEGLGFPGEQTRRESADFATGAAGIGLFLNRLLRTHHCLSDNFNFVVDEILEDSQSEIIHTTANSCMMKNCQAPPVIQAPPR